MKCPLQPRGRTTVRKGKCSFFLDLMLKIWNKLSLQRTLQKKKVNIFKIMSKITLKTLLITPPFQVPGGLWKGGTPSEFSLSTRTENWSFSSILSCVPSIPELFSEDVPATCSENNVGDHVQELVEKTVKKFPQPHDSVGCVFPFLKIPEICTHEVPVPGSTMDLPQDTPLRPGKDQWVGRVPSLPVLRHHWIRVFSLAPVSRHNWARVLNLPILRPNCTLDKFFHQILWKICQFSLQTGQGLGQTSLNWECAW